jgi:dimeric dUTPase (all-alpha-NTP-PPase superfamily)
MVKRLDFSEIYNLQQEFDQTLIQDKELVPGELFDKKLLAVKAELGELANEHRGFKFWSENQKPSYTKVEELDAHQVRESNPLLEEYADCIKFSLSLAADLGIEASGLYDWYPEPEDSDTVRTFNLAYYYISVLSVTADRSLQRNYFQNFFLNLVALGLNHFEFTEEQIIEAFKEKHQVNYKRLETGY